MGLGFIHDSTACGMRALPPWARVTLCLAVFGRVSQASGFFTCPEQLGISRASDQLSSGYMPEEVAESQAGAMCSV